MKADGVLLTGKKFRGQIRYIASMARDSTRTLLVELAINNSAGYHIISGQTSTIHIPLQEEKPINSRPLF